MQGGFVARLGVFVGYAVTIGASAIGSVAAWVVTVRRRKRRRAEKLAVERMGLPWGGANEAEFLGREADETRFRALLNDWTAPDHTKPARLVIITGSAGIGKRELLGRFRMIHAERSPGRCGPLLDLREPRSPLDVMRTIADEFQLGSAFGRFQAQRERYEDKTAGRPEPLEQATNAASGVANVASMTNLSGGDVAKAGVEALPKVVGAFQESFNLEDLERRFLLDLTEFADQRPHEPVTLFVANLDAWPENQTPQWLSKTVFPKLTTFPVLVVVSVAEDRTRRRLEKAVHSALTIRLGPLSSVECQRYAEDVIGLSDPKLVQQVIEQSGGSPHRLVAFRRFFEDDERRRGVRKLSMEAEAAASGAAIDELRQKVGSRFLWNLMLASAPLRWFNEALLQDVAAMAELGPLADQEGLRVVDLLQDHRTLWVKYAGGGWAIDAERTALAAEYRRLDPVRWRQVHLIGARYHYRRLLAAEGQEPTGDLDVSALLTDRPTPSSDRFVDDDWTISRCELLYHLLVLAPDDAWGALVDDAMEALCFDEENEAALRLLEAGAELRGRRAQQLARLHRLADAIRDERWMDAEQVLVEETTSSDTWIQGLAAAAARHVLGRVHYQLGQIDQAARSFELADAQLQTLDGVDTRVVRIRCINAAWQAFALSWQFNDRKRSLEVLERAVADAERFDDASLRAIVEELRAAVHEHLGDLIAAEQYYADSLEHATGADPSKAATLRCRLADVVIRLEKYQDAEQQLDTAAAAYAVLGDADGRIRVLLGRLGLAAARQDRSGLAQWRDELLRRRADDAGIHNLAGNALASHGWHEPATQLHQRAVELDPGVSMYHANLGFDLAELGRREEAIRSYREAARLAHDDPSPVRMLLKLEDNPDAKRSAAAQLADRLLHLGGSIEGGSASQRRFPATLRPEFDEAIAELDSAERGQLLREATERFPRDPLFRLELREYNKSYEVDEVASSEDPLTILEQAYSLLDDSDAPATRQRYAEELAAQLAGRQRLTEAAELLDQARTFSRLSSEGAELAARIQRLRQLDSWSPGDPLDRQITVVISADLSGWFDRELRGPLRKAADEFYTEILPNLRKQLHARSGVRLPGVGVTREPRLTSREIHIRLCGVQRRALRLETEHLATLPAGAPSDGLLGHPGTRPWDGGPALWIRTAHIDRFRAAGARLWDPRGMVATQLAYLIDEQCLASFVGVDEAAELIRMWDDDLGAIPPARIAVMLRRLLAESVPVANSLALGEAVRAAGPEASALALVEEARRRLVPGIVTRWAGADGNGLRALTLCQKYEEDLLGHGGVERDGRHEFLVLPEPAGRAVAEAVRAASQRAGTSVLLVRRRELRPHMWSLCHEAVPLLRVVTPDELGELRLNVVEEVLVSEVAP
jgi:tetratricopeptide (TPR) repeat protein